MLINNSTQFVYSLYVWELDSGNVFLTVSSIFLQNSNTYPGFNFYSFLSTRYHTATYSVVLGRGSEIMKKKIFLLFLSFVISHTSEIDIILSGLSEKKEKIFLTENMKIKNQLYDINLTEGNGVVLYYNEGKIVKEERYDNVEFKKYHIVLYSRIRFDEESKILKGIQKNIDYYDYIEKKIQKITLYIGEYKIFEMKINKNGEIESLIEGKCKKFISFQNKENCKKTKLLQKVGI